MPDNLLPDLAPQGVDHLELLYLLKSHFKIAQISDKDVISLPPGSRHRLRVKVERDGIRHILRGPGFDPVEFAELQRQVQEQLVDSPGETIGRAILFSSLPVPGTLDMPEVGLRISPAPDSAPRPDVIYADHPFLLEFRMRRGGGDWTVSNQRRIKLAGEWSLVLNALLRTRIWFPTPRGTHHWVYDNDSGVSRWLSGSYFVPDFALYADSFTKTAAQALPLVPHDEYYGSDVRPGAERDALTLPDSLPELLGVFARLAPRQRRQYLRAATWIQIASRTWNVGASSWFTAHVSAIETFVEPDYDDKCAKCGSVLGVTRAFKGLVERYSPDSTKKMRDAIYDLRSDLSHGEALLQLDESPWSFGSTFREQEYDASQWLVRVTRDVMVNWLRKFGAMGRLVTLFAAVKVVKQQGGGTAATVATRNNTGTVSLLWHAIVQVWRSGIALLSLRRRK